MAVNYFLALGYLSTVADTLPRFTQAEHGLLCWLVCRRTDVADINVLPSDIDEPPESK